MHPLRLCVKTKEVQCFGKKWKKKGWNVCRKCTRAKNHPGLFSVLMRIDASVSFPIAFPVANPYVNDTLLSPVTTGSLFYSPPRRRRVTTPWSIIHLPCTAIARGIACETKRRGSRPDVIHERRGHTVQPRSRSISEVRTCK